MNGIAIVLTFEVKLESRAAFLRLFRNHAAATLAEEPGCLRFDILTDRDDPRAVHVYEVYRDSDALAAHRRSSRLAPLRAAYTDLITAKRSALCDLLAGETAGSSRGKA